MDTKKIMGLGFSEKEAQVYMGLMELGPSPVSNIAKKARVKRSTCYVILKILIEKGFASISDEKKVRLYIAAPPERLIQLLEEETKKNSERIATAHQLLPELKSMYTGTGPKPTIQYFEGVEGLISVYEDTLTASAEILSFASIEDVHATLPHYFPSYYTRRVARNIRMRAIFPDTVAARERVKKDKEEYRTTHLVPADRFGFSSEINIYGNKIAIMSLREKFGLIIDSPELSDTLRKTFELSWEAAKKMSSTTATAL